MRCGPWLALILLPAAAVWCTPAWSQTTPPLVPLDDPLANLPMLPGGVNRSVPELFGNYAQVWSQPDGTQVMLYFGDFSLHLGDRALRSQDAVVWMQKSVWENIQYYHFDVYLSRFASVKEAAGTVTTDYVLFVTFNTLKPAAAEADVFSGQPGVNTTLYQDGEKVRSSLSVGPVTSEERLQVTKPGKSAATPRPKARPSVRLSTRGEWVYDDREGIITVTGGVYLAQGLLDSDQFLEIKADAAVIFMAKREQAKEGAQGGESAMPSLAPALEGFGAQGQGQQGGRAGGFGFGGGPQGGVAGVYLQGDVVMTRGDRLIRASEIFYDFENDRALILDAVMKGVVPDRNLPIYVRAKSLRQLSNTEYYAGKAIISTSEFYTPHVHIGAERVYLTDRTPRDQSGRITNFEAGEFRAHDATFNVEGIPIAYWPYAKGDFRQAQDPIRNLRMGYSDDFGAIFKSQWYLFNLLGVEAPQGVDAVLRLDYLSKRGPGAGLDVDYEKPDSYGLFRAYYIHDVGTDHLGPYRDNDPDTENRGRLTWRHRQFLPQGWELTLEGSWISDPNFLEEYFRPEFFGGKEQETLVYLKKQQDNWAFTTLAQWRVLDFLTQTEHLPDLGFNWVGQPLDKFASYFNETHLGAVRYRPDDRRLFENGPSIAHIDQNDFASHVTFREDTRNELDFPIKLGDAKVVPFAMGRAGYWSGSPHEGGTDRVFGQVGVRTGTQFFRTFQDACSRLLDVNGIRHIIKPEITTWFSASDRNSLDLFPFDQNIEGINDFYGSSFALRQTWQTKRGPLGQQRVVDWIKFDVELNVFGNLPRYQLPIGRFYDYRPEDSVALNHVRTDFQYRISDTATILTEANWNLNDGTANLFDISYAVEHSPRFSYFVGYRRIHPTDSSLVGGGVNYVLNEKNNISLRGYYDLERNKLESLDVILVHKWPRWYTGVMFGVDKVRDIFNANVTIWPEGAPELSGWSRRYTSLSESTGIRPEK